jgi:hypothetical protein
MKRGKWENVQPARRNAGSGLMAFLYERPEKTISGEYDVCERGETRIFSSPLSSSQGRKK